MKLTTIALASVLAISSSMALAAGAGGAGGGAAAGGTGAHRPPVQWAPVAQAAQRVPPERAARQV